MDTRGLSNFLEFNSGSDVLFPRLKFEFVILCKRNIIVLSLSSRIYKIYMILELSWHRIIFPANSIIVVIYNLTACAPNP